MLAKAYRFHGHNSLSFVYRAGKTARSPQLTLRYVPNSRRSTYRVAVVVGKKISKSAVVRNRIRRRVYEQVRGLTPVTERYDLVVTAFNVQVADMAEKELKETIMHLMQVADIPMAE